MKRINKKSLITLLALTMIFVTTIGLTVSYFSDTDTAKGESGLVLSPTTTVEEGPDNTEKHIKITNSDTGAAVLVRVKVFGPDDPLMKVSISGGSWQKSNTDGWYYYTKVLEAGKETEGTIDAVLKEDLTAQEEFELGDNFNVTVVHEAQVVTMDGSNIVTPDGWDTSIHFTTN